jgi:hypothetical protein
MNQFRTYYIYTWKCHNDIVILSQKKCLFTKTKDRQVKQVLSILHWYQWKEGGYKERVKGEMEK